MPLPAHGRRAGDPGKRMRSRWTPLQVRRLLVAALTFMVVSLVLLAALLHGRALQSPDRAAATWGGTCMQESASLQDALSAAGGGSCDALPAALCSMLFPLDDCTVTGVSPDGRIVGLDTGEAPAGIRGRVIDGMEERGWVSLDPQGDAVLSFVHEGPWDDGRVQSDGRYAKVGFALVVIQPLDDSTSVLVQLA